MPYKILLFFAALVFAGPAARAQDAHPTAPAAAPLEISADTALEWDRANSKYFARGNAVAKQNDMQVQADTLTADYRQGPDKKTQIYRLTATGHVILTSGDAKGYGDNAVYDVDTGKAVLTGQNLHIENPDSKITATEKFEYYAQEGRMVAIGSPVVTNKDSVLTADHITAWTDPKAKKSSSDKTTAAGQTSFQPKSGKLNRAEAEGHVVITNPKEKATADKGVYTGATDTVELFGHVKLAQGDNTLQGAHAEMNLATNLSRVYGDPKDGGRAKGVFFPGSETADAKSVPDSPK